MKHTFAEQLQASAVAAIPVLRRQNEELSRVLAQAFKLGDKTAQQLYAEVKKSRIKA